MKQLKKILSNLLTILCESNFNDFEYLMILKNKCIKKKIDRNKKETRKIDSSSIIVCPKRPMLCSFRLAGAQNAANSFNFLIRQLGQDWIENEDDTFIEI